VDVTRLALTPARGIADADSRRERGKLPIDALIPLPLTPALSRRERE
jgi:hypothetical protein